MNKIPEKSKTQNFKNPKQYFCEDHWEEILEKVWKDSKRDLREDYRFEVLAPIGSHVNENEKNS